MISPPFPIRPITTEELPAYRRVLGEAFGMERPMQPWWQRVYEPPRTLVAFDGSTMVGVTAAFSFQMAVPGGVRPVAGVTGVGVLPTHRRRGVLRSLMTRQLTDLHEHGEPVAALVASESTIYGRYGYGAASRKQTFTFHRGEHTFDRRAPVDPDLRLRLSAPAQARAELRAVYDAAFATRPGGWARVEPWWDRLTNDPPEERGQAGPLRCVIAEDGRGARGYAVYVITPSWGDHGLPDSRMDVREVFATDPAAYAAVWSYLLGHDLVATVVAEDRPEDDPLLRLLADPRRSRAQVYDDMWVRLVDVDRALEARAYSRPVEVVLEVDDPLCPWNRGRFRLTADDAGARCEPTGDPADVALPVDLLGAAYLGGVGLSGPAAAGLVEERRAGAVRRLSAALAWDPRPWCPMIF